MTTILEVKTAMQELVENFFGFPVIFARQNAARPPKPYATIDFTPSIRLGLADEVRQSGTDGEVEYVGQRTIMMEVNIFAANSMDNAQDLQLALNSHAIHEPLSSVHNISILSEGNVLDIDALLDDQYEERALLEVKLGYRATLESNNGLIEKVEIINNLDEPPTTTIVELAGP